MYIPPTMSEEGEERLASAADGGGGNDDDMSTWTEEEASWSPKKSIYSVNSGPSDWSFVGEDINDDTSVDDSNWYSRRRFFNRPAPRRASDFSYADDCYNEDGGEGMSAHRDDNLASSSSTAGTCSSWDFHKKYEDTDQDNEIDQARLRYQQKQQLQQLQQQQQQRRRLQQQQHNLYPRFPPHAPFESTPPDFLKEEENEDDDELYYYKKDGGQDEDDNSTFQRLWDD